MGKLRFLTAIFSIFILAACGTLSPTAAGDPDPCDDPEPELVELCEAFGTIGSDN